MTNCKFSMIKFTNKLKKRSLAKLCGLFNCRMTTIFDGNKVYYDPNTEIGRALLYTGEFEKNELKLCGNYISKDSIILDIGANIGLHSLFFSMIAQEGRVLSFEPSLETYELLGKNVRDRPNITPINIAASGAGGLLDFFQASDNAYSSLMDTKRKTIVRVAKVPSMKIDDVVGALNLPRVDFVKIDVEGLEQDVMKGMYKVLEKFHPVVFCEIYQGVSSNPSPEETVNFLLQRHYNAYVICNGEILEYETHDDRYYNYLFLPKGRVN